MDWGSVERNARGKEKYVHMFGNSCVKNARKNCLRKDAAKYTKNIKCELPTMGQGSRNTLANSVAARRRAAYLLDLVIGLDGFPG